VNTADGGEPRSGAQRLGEPGSFEPGVDHLITALTTRAHPHELAGRDAALAAFREASRPAARWARIWPPALSARLRRPAGPRRPVRVLLPVRLAVAAASVIAVLAGLTAAAAAQALPAPVQQIAYHVLAPLGVPVTRPTPPRPGAQSRVPHGHPAPSAAVTVSGSNSPAASEPAARPTPAPTGSHPARKAKATVTRPVLRLVALKVDDRFVVVAPSDKAGDTVNLTELVGGTWTTVAARPLGPKHRAFFLLRKTEAAGHLFMAEIPRAKRKVASASNRLWIPRLPKTGAKGIKPLPDPTTTATTTPDATTTPIVTAIPSPSTTTLPLPPPTASPTLAGSPTPTASPTPSESGTPTPSGGQTPAPSPTVSGTSAASQPPPPPI
jgi:hypothetical protein